MRSSTKHCPFIRLSPNWESESEKEKGERASCSDSPVHKRNV